METVVEVEVGTHMLDVDQRICLGGRMGYL
jgi:hypothetical protein